MKDLIDDFATRLARVEGAITRHQSNPAPAVPQYDLEESLCAHGLLAQNDLANDGQVRLWKNLSSLTDIYLDYTFTFATFDFSGNLFWLELNKYAGDYTAMPLRGNRGGAQDLAGDTSYIARWANFGQDETTEDLFEILAGGTPIVCTQHHVRERLTYNGSHSAPPPWTPGTTNYQWTHNITVDGVSYGSITEVLNSFWVDYGGPGDHTFDHISMVAINPGGMAPGSRIIFQSLLVGTTGFGSSDLLNVPNFALITLPGPFDGFYLGSDGTGVLSII